jgi:hypothetical protein
LFFVFLESAFCGGSATVQALDCRLLFVIFTVESPVTAVAKVPTIVQSLKLFRVTARQLIVTTGGNRLGLKTRSFDDVGVRTCHADRCARLKYFRQ